MRPTSTLPDPDAGLGRRLPTPEEIDSAAHAAQAIAVAMEVDGGLKVTGAAGDPVRIAPAVGEFIIELLGHVASGRMVTLAPIDALLTTQQAADMLNVSRPHLTGLLKDGEIEHVVVGRHRRVPLPALMEYRERRRRGREQALDDLARLGQELERED